MSQLQVALLGTFQVAIDGEPVTGFAYDKARALFAYLAIEAERPHRREALAALLWPDLDSRAARHNLSQALLIVRRALSDSTADPPWLLLDADSVRLNPAADIDLDVARVAELLDACDRHTHRRLEACRACAARLERVVTLYRGDLLEGFSLPDALPFDEWALVGRERLRRRVVAALPALSTFYQRRGNASRAASVAQRLIDIEPWHEAGWRALMLALAASGRRAEALDAYERCRRMLDDELGILPDAETTALAQRIREGTQGAPTIGRLPEQPTPFVGRERELASLAAMLADPDCRLITLVGPGGIGKTRLALQLALDETGAWEDGAHFVPLAGPADPGQLVTAIGDAVGVSFQGSINTREQLLDWLHDRDLLLVLDNAEHLLEGIGLLATILDRAPRVQIIVSTRERLNLRREWVVEVDGLSVPSDPCTDVESADAGRLFMQRGRQVRPGFEPDAADRGAIDRICRLTEGMPLAIEIAAAWLAVLTCQEIASEIERGLDFLATAQRDVPERHRSLRAVFDGSWTRLRADEQHAFRRLSIFRGGFERAAAEHVAGASLPVLSALVSTSLMRRNAGGRYELHELLRQYGEQRLAQTDDATAVGERHSSWYLSFLAEQEPRLKGPEQAAAIAQVRAEIENLRAAWFWAIAHGRIERVAAAIESFWIWWDLTGRYQEWEALLAAAIAALERDPGAAADPMSDRHLARLLTRYGASLLRLGDMTGGRAALDRAIALFSHHGDERDLGLALNIRAAFARAAHDAEAERRDLRESIAVFDAAGDRWGASYSRNDLGALEDRQGNDVAAHQLQEASLAGFTALGDRRGMAFVLTNLGIAAARRGDYPAARRHHADSLAIRRDLVNPWGIATSLIQLGIVAWQAGDREEARRRLVEALRTAWDVRSLPVVTDAAIELAELDLVEGRHETSLPLLAALQHHPAAAAATRERAGQLLGTLAAPPVTAIELDTIVRDILDQPARSGPVGSR